MSLNKGEIAAHQHIGNVKFRHVHDDMGQILFRCTQKPFVFRIQSLVHIFPQDIGNGLAFGSVGQKLVQVLGEYGGPERFVVLDQSVFVVLDLPVKKVPQTLVGIFET